MSKEIASFRDDFRRKCHLEALEEHNSRLARVKGKLEAPDYQCDQEMATENRTGIASGAWLLRNQAFQKWADKGTRGHEILYLNGMPGAGEL